jgi:hypothetical protein|tara:strand:- start:78 stop:452 length:375 start_codon:yes stop_codon:yes gene_type:complete
MTGNYNLYFSITKESWKQAIPTELQGKYSSVVEDEEGNTTINTPDSWEEAYEAGAFPWLRECLDWNTQEVDNEDKVAIFKDEFSVLTGELSALIAMGDGKTFPYNSVLTKSEARDLVGGSLFNE